MAASLLFAGEASLLYAGIGSVVLLLLRRPFLAVGLVAGMLATLPVEAVSKRLLDHPSPERFVATVARPSCAPAAPSAPAQAAQAARSVQAALPSAAAGEAAYSTLASLPSGYIARATAHERIAGGDDDAERPHGALTMARGRGPTSERDTLSRDYRETLTRDDASSIRMRGIRPPSAVTSG
jgi:hypothetical protein